MDEICLSGIMISGGEALFIGRHLAIIMHPPF